ncbi:putative cyclin-dependent kinase F-2 [Brachypodium distachyon]|uniref:Protein kinase domain-containing protein n=1 Tax=Brachypodium distachyon TaxID=15368 RepID=I1IWG8_BRADI|nr:putative cyclin-dependent kinase F-2 [Brachypodium distachyon]KQJ81950.1 hypothetical protein BRADI_5g04010v3 [Brachypodium distachyon]|eukprot:XP_003581082.1 putative cyclin-dependent kinase F-2 [Brachypodium distachyon]
MADDEEHAGAETRIAAIFAMIREHDASDETAMSDAQVAAAISALIAAAAAHGTTTTITGIVGSILDDYDEFRKLGSGSAGVVTKARHRATGKTVALKSLHGYSGGTVRDLLREACFMVGCPAHPSLVTLHGMARTESTNDYCLVMDYVDGPTLHDCIRMGHRRRPFPEAHARRVMRQLLSAAAHMHQHGVIHRDIKPENILVDDDHRVVKICDFGSALYCTHDAEECYYAAGTRPYSAPEMLLEKPGGYDALVDTWSLGCVMAELLTGEVLFDGGCDSDTLYEIFDLLGVPGKRAWKPYEASFVAHKVPLWRREQQRRRRHCNRLGELFPEELLSRDGFQVLKGLLTCDPSKRLPAAAALQLPWFAAHDDSCEASFGSS